MKYKHLRFKFKQPLNVEQEKYFIGFFVGFGATFKNEFTRIANYLTKYYNSPELRVIRALPGGAAMLTSIIIKVNKLGPLLFTNESGYIILNKIDERTYSFEYAFEDLSAINIDNRKLIDLVKKFKLPIDMPDSTQIGEAMNEKKIIDLFCNVTLPKMFLTIKDLEIDVTDVEKEA